ncbi:MAG: EAL domain-containing protein [Campylobacterales bacterium]|nr:EAL domain-containing protein [Campylobacterales bacterium]
MTIEEIKNITKNLNILLVEDDLSVLTITAKTLEIFFPNLDTAVNGLEALEKFKSTKYDIVITDLAMPKMDGIEMIKQMKLIDPNLDVIIFSAMNNPKAIVESLRLGIDGYLFKPLVFDKFIEIMKNVLNKEVVKTKLSNYNTMLLDQYDKKTQALIDGLYQDKITSLGSLSLLMTELENLDKFVSPVIILLNIDHFKVYNQLYGIDKGNEILIRFGEILKQFNQNRTYNLFRINADEFVLLDKIEYMDIEKYENDMEELFSLDLSFHIDGIEEEIELEITAGISFSSTEPLKKANMALFEARKRGRNFIGFSYDIDYTEELQSNLFWRQEIKDAINEKRVVAFYQPIVDRDKHIVQYESLIRIKKLNENGQWDYLVPEEFLDLSIMTKQYLKLTKFMIETTMRKMKEANVAISINLTYQDIKNNDIYGTLKENIRKFHLEDMAELDISNNVIFEILEHEGIDCYKSFVDFIKEFKEMGVRIALDDFGTGFSNFSHITTLTPDFIKIDGALIKNIHNDEKSYNLVNAIVKFAQQLNIKTIAEHVHSEEIFNMVYDLGIDKFQGYYFGAPSENIL